MIFRNWDTWSRDKKIYFLMLIRLYMYHKWDIIFNNSSNKSLFKNSFTIIICVYKRLLNIYLFDNFNWMVMTVTDSKYHLNVHNDAALVSLSTFHSIYLRESVLVSWWIINRKDHLPALSYASSASTIFDISTDNTTNIFFTQTSWEKVSP